MSNPRAELRNRAEIFCEQRESTLTEKSSFGLGVLHHFNPTGILSGLVFGLLLLHFTLPSQAQSPADLVVINAHIVTCDEGFQKYEAVAIQNGRFVAVGSSAEIRSRIGPETQVVDAAGQTITPGLIDSHVHFVGLGESLQMLNLMQANSWEAIVQQVETAAKQTAPGNWIEGRGWHQSKWLNPPSENVDGYPVHTSMSSVTQDHPVVLTHASGHACFANAAAMKLAGIDRETPDPPGGQILRDEKGNAIGVFLENAQSLIRRAKARADREVSDADRQARLQEQIRLAGDACLKFGITTVHDAGSSFALAQKLREFAEAGQLPVRMLVMIRAGSRELQGRLAAARIDQAGDGFLTVRSVKVSIDGALGPHGAWLLQPYYDLPDKVGFNTVTLDELQIIAEMCKANQWQLCVHAIGDRANREVLDTYERVLGVDATGDHRWRMEHAQHLSVEDIPRFGKLGVIPAMQANHCTSDAPFVPLRLGERRSAEGAYVWRSLIDSGAIIANGTDAPVESIDPRVSLYASVTRQLPDGSKFYPEQCMTREEALLSYTRWAARAGFQDHLIGSIEVGKRADFVIWNTDLLNCEAAELLNAHALRVWLGGSERTVALPK